MTNDDSRAATKLLRSRALLQVAYATPAGAPAWATVAATVTDDAVVFDAGWADAPAGRQVVVRVHEEVCRLPAEVAPEVAMDGDEHWYRAAELEGVLERRPALTVSLCGSGSRLRWQAKLGQQLAPAQRTRVLEALWRRGAPGDAAAIETIRRANPDRANAPVPTFLSSPAGTQLSTAAGPDDLPATIRLLADAYWLPGASPEMIAIAHLSSTAWVCATDGAGSLVGTARATSDRVRFAGIYDVMVAAAWRGRGVGQALVRLLLDHPALRDAATITLRTRDAQALYRKFGFLSREEAPPAAFAATDMVLVRRAAAPP